jgi:hypothetical protein
MIQYVDYFRQKNFWGPNTAIYDWFSIPVPCLFVAVMSEQQADRQLVVAYCNQIYWMCS